MNDASGAQVPRSQRPGSIKCVVWDLDRTLWDGVLLEDATVTLRPAVADAIRRLDERGILQSIASRNDHDTATARLRALGLDEYFLAPQINWNAKSSSVAAIARALNIGLDAIAFVDDDALERDEVAGAHPEVLCIDAVHAAALPEWPALTPRFVTDDARERRRMMQASMARDAAEAEFTGTPVAFLASLGMVFTVARAREEDLRRAEELTLRTNQLNTTGRTYSYEELAALSVSPDHLLLVAGLEDRYGSYGRVGLALVSIEAGTWTIRLLLMSCRVLSRGAGSLLLTYVMRMARQAGVRLQSEFVATPRNRMMLLTYRLAGFRVVSEADGATLLEHDLSTVPEFPAHVRLETDSDQVA